MPSAKKKGPVNAAAPAKKGAKRKKPERQLTEAQIAEQQRSQDLQHRAKRDGLFASKVHAADAFGGTFTSETPAGMRIAGCNVIRKNQAKKVKFLFQFPGPFTPNADEGITIGEVRDINTKNPIVFLKTPGAYVKLHGVKLTARKTHYINLVKQGSDVKVEDDFSTVIVLGDPQFVVVQ